MERREILSNSNPGRAQWAELTRWALTRVPLSDRAALYKGTSEAAVKFTTAVDGLIGDVLKKLNHSRRGEVNLDPPPAEVVPQEGSSPFSFIWSATALTKVVVARRRAVRISYPDPDRLRSPEPTGQPGESFDWRGPSHQLGFGLMATPTMDCLVQMVRGELPGLAELDLTPQYLIGATAAGTAALQEGSSTRLGPQDMVFLRTDEHVQAWTLLCVGDPLDLLVVVRRPVADSISPPRVRGGRGTREGQGTTGRTTGGEATREGATGGSSGVGGSQGQEGRGEVILSVAVPEEATASGSSVVGGTMDRSSWAPVTPVQGGSSGSEEVMDLSQRLGTARRKLFGL